MKLMILDGNSIINRAFYGIRMLNAPDGTPTNAVYGFRHGRAPLRGCRLDVRRRHRR